LAQAVSKTKSFVFRAGFVIWAMVALLQTCCKDSGDIEEEKCMVEVRNTFLHFSPRSKSHRLRRAQSNPPSPMDREAARPRFHSESWDAAHAGSPICRFSPMTCALNSMSQAHGAGLNTHTGARVEWNCCDFFGVSGEDTQPARHPTRHGCKENAAATTASPQPKRQVSLHGTKQRGEAQLLSADPFILDKLSTDEAPKSEPLYGPITDADNILTVMIKNIPCGCKQAGIMQAIEDLGFGSAYNFFYVPTRRNGENFGYAFVGFPNPETTSVFYQAMTGYCFNFRKNKKIVEVVPARFQGLQETYEHFKSSHTMRGPRPPIFVTTKGIAGA